jgi:hypothetical protein
MDIAFLARGLSVLDKYAVETGGDAFYLDSTDSLEKAYFRATDEARNQYVLGYFSSNKPPGSLPIFREIKVMTRNPRFDITHRKGYYQYP